MSTFQSEGTLGIAHFGDIGTVTLLKRERHSAVRWRRDLAGTHGVSVLPYGALSKNGGVINQNQA